MTHAPDYATVTLPASGGALLPDVLPWPHQLDAAAEEPRLVYNTFVLGQNYPNPHSGETTIPFTLLITADVHLNLFDHQGRKVAGVMRGSRSAGAQHIALNLKGLELPAGNYIYQLQVSSRFGTYQQAKQMTIE